MDGHWWLIATNDPRAEELVAQVQADDPLGALAVHDVSGTLQILERLARASGLRGPAWLARFDLPAVVLLDAELPDDGALRVLRWIRRHRWSAHLPVVILLAPPPGPHQSRLLPEAADLHVNAYIRKPADLTGFRQMLVISSEFWLRLNQQPIPPSIGDQPRHATGRVLT